MLIEKIDCVFIWAGDKMIDCRQLGRWNCSAALRITEGLFSPPLLPHLCTTPFVFLSVAPSPFHWSFSVSREFSTVMGHFCPLQTPGGKIFKLRSEQRESTCAYDKWTGSWSVSPSVVLLYLFGFKKLSSLEFFLALAALHFSFTCTRSERTLSPSVCLHICLSYKKICTFLYTSKCVQGAQMGGCVWTAEYIISLLYHHYCSCRVSASVIMICWLVAR